MFGERKVWSWWVMAVVMLWYCSPVFLVWSVHVLFSFGLVGHFLPGFLPLWLVATPFVCLFVWLFVSTCISLPPPLSLSPSFCFPGASIQALFLSDLECFWLFLSVGLTCICLPILHFGPCCLSSLLINTLLRPRTLWSCAFESSNLHDGGMI